jgi:thymidylate synthase
MLFLYRRFLCMSASPRVLTAKEEGTPERLLHRLDWQVIRRLDGLLQGDYRTLFYGDGLDFADLREYVYELEGVKDGWVKCINDPDDTRWEYTYHGRMANYGQWKEKGEDGQSQMTGDFDVDQVRYVIDKLVDQPFTRQAQMITWMPNLDLDCYDPPCLQSIWYRILEDEEGVWWLNCNVRFRSNDAWGANFMNMFGFIQFNKGVIAAEVARRTGRQVELGRLNWHADSYHIYGKDIEQAEARLFSRLENSSLEDRVYNFNDEMIQEMYHEDEQKILAKIDEMNTRM